MADCAQFLRMLEAGSAVGYVGILQQETVGLMTTNQLRGDLFRIPVDREPWPGVGVRVEDASEHGLLAGTFGWIGISGTAACILPGADMYAPAMPQPFCCWKAADTLREPAYQPLPHWGAAAV